MKHMRERDRLVHRCVCAHHLPPLVFAGVVKSGLSESSLINDISSRVSDRVNLLRKANRFSRHCVFRRFVRSSVNTVLNDLHGWRLQLYTPNFPLTFCLRDPCKVDPCEVNPFARTTRTCRLLRTLLYGLLRIHTSKREKRS